MGRIKQAIARARGRLSKSHSPLRDAVWAVISDQQTTGGLTHDQALRVANEIRGTVTTNTAADRAAQ